MFEETIELKDIDKQDPEYKELLSRVLTIQSDCEIGGPHLYVEHILPSAPTKGYQVVVARTAAEEIDHFRKMARMAGEIGTDVSHVLKWGNDQRYVEAFRTTITTWEDYAVFGFLVDRVGKFQLDEFLDCSYAPLDRAVRTMEPEEEGHIEFGTVEAGDLAARGGEWKERVQKSVDYWYVKSLDMFGNSNSYRSERFRYWRLKRRSNADARAEYMAEVNPLIEKMGLTIPDPLEGRLYL
ncbi:MAG: ring,2-phenylacetyl-CoA epoxidase subunit PaaA [Chloroflexota bacterium]|nr:ring,2-phenylacetyl-CoA epoxidase subunit PaaA [Chloroflexota bacterium]